MDSLLTAIRGADIIIGGSGLYGLTIAERAANVLGLKVVVLDRRNNIGGNSYSYLEPQTGIEVHKYGSHLFHTSNQEVWDYVLRFTKFNNYRHHVFAKHKNHTYSLPINLHTMNAFFGRSLNPNQARELIAEKTISLKIPKDSNLEGKAISLVGEELYDAFIKGYTQKQWQSDPRDLPAEIIQRLPVRYDYDSYYFSDKWEGVPIDGYEPWMLRMAENPNIKMHLGVDILPLIQYINDSQLLVYTGAVDEYFNYVDGHLSWRTLDLELEILPIKDFQGTSVMNYSDISDPFTRIHEFKHLHPERSYLEKSTVIMREFSRASLKGDEPFYPVNGPKDRTTLKSYRERAKLLPNVIFGGRLGTYQYLDMHMAIASALSTFSNEIISWHEKRKIHG